MASSCLNARLRPYADRRSGSSGIHPTNGRRRERNESDSYALIVRAGERDSELRLADLVGAFSLATDLGLGQPMEHVLRSWVIAGRLGGHLGVEPDDRGALYYSATLAWVGCVADTPELATWFGDDIAFRADSRRVDLAGLPMLGFMLRHVGVGSPALHRIRRGAKLVATGGKGVEQVLLSHCLTTARMAERLGLGADVCDPLQQVFTRWDGKGVPGGVGGEEIAFPMRLLQLADIVEVFHRIDGTDSAVEVARARRGKQFDPAVVDAFCDVAPDVLGDASSDVDWEALIDEEPALQRRLNDPQLDAGFAAGADFAATPACCPAPHPTHPRAARPPRVGRRAAPACRPRCRRARPGRGAVAGLRRRGPKGGARRGGGAEGAARGGMGGEEGCGRRGPRCDD